MKQKNSLRMEVCQYLLQMKWQDYQEEIQRDLSKQEDIKLSQVKEIKEDSKENAKIMCKYDNSKNCHTKLIQRQQEHLDTNGLCSGCCRLCDHPSNCRYRCENTPLGWKPTQQHCEYVCENVLENKKISEKDLESVTFTFQDVKTTLRYINQQISKTKMNDKETIVRLKVISESLKIFERNEVDLLIMAGRRMVNIRIIDSDNFWSFRYRHRRCISIYCYVRMMMVSLTIQNEYSA